MALMGVNIDKRTNAGLANAGTLTFAHGLGGAPDIVRIRYIATQIVTGNSNWKGMAIPVDATNVSIINFGSTTSPNFEVVSIRLHTLIQ